MKRLLSLLLVTCLIAFGFAFAAPGELGGAKITSIKFSHSDITKQVGSQFQMQFVVTPKGAAKGGVVWVSSDPATVKVNQKGLVTCLKTGFATVKAISKGSIASAACVIEVVPANSKVPKPSNSVKQNIAVKAIAINHTQIKLPVGDSYYLVATFTPPNASNRNVKWYVKQPHIATIDPNGLLTAKLAGKTTVVVESANGKTFQCQVYVEPLCKNSREINLDTVMLDFNDIYGVAELDSIKYVFAKGLMNGVSDVQFAPYSGVSRAMIATILYRIQGEPGAIKHRRFKDVTWDKWYSLPVFWIDKVGIMKGLSESEFSPNGDLTREQLATILFRYAKMKGLNPKGAGFLYALGIADHDQVSDWSSEALIWAYNNKILKVDRGLIYPKATASRADLARAIHVFFVDLLE